MKHDIIPGKFLQMFKRYDIVASDLFDQPFLLSLEVGLSLRFRFRTHSSFILLTTFSFETKALSLDRELDGRVEPSIVGTFALRAAART